MDRVGVRELRQNPTPVLRAVEAGAEVAVTVNGRAVARLVPFESVPWVDGARAAQIYAASVDEDWADELQRAREEDAVDDPWS
jgi:prevent-host-death family protein